MGLLTRVITNVEPEIIRITRETTTGSLIEETIRHGGVCQTEWRIGGARSQPPPYPTGETQGNPIKAFFKSFLPGTNKPARTTAPYHIPDSTSIPPDPNGFYPGMPGYMTPEQYFRSVNGEAVQTSPHPDLTTTLTQGNSPINTPNPINNVQEAVTPPENSAEPVLTSPLRNIVIPIEVENAIQGIEARPKATSIKKKLLPVLDEKAILREFQAAGIASPNPSLSPAEQLRLIVHHHPEIGGILVEHAQAARPTEVSLATRTLEKRLQDRAKPLNSANAFQATNLPERTNFRRSHTDSISEQIETPAATPVPNAFAEAPRNEQGFYPWEVDKSGNPITEDNYVFS